LVLVAAACSTEICDKKPESLSRLYRIQVCMKE